MDEYKNVSLDQALLPDRDNPLLPAQFIPNTGLNTFKIIQIGTAVINKAANSSIGTVTIQHGLGYVPAVLVYQGNSTDGFGQFPFVNTLTSGTNAGLIYSYSDVFIDKNQLILRYLTPSWSGNTQFTQADTIDVQYYLLYQTAGTN